MLENRNDHCQVCHHYPQTICCYYPHAHTRAPMPVVHLNGKTPPPEPPGPPVLGDPQLDPANRLGLVLQALGRAQEEWDESQRIADDIDPVEDPEALSLARRQIRECYRRWFEISNQAHDLAETTRRSAMELHAGARWDRERAEIVRNLKDQFEGGPHYDLLCERVGSLTVRLKQMESSGRDYSAQEHATLNTQMLGYINQLQKYTEAMKSESISREAQSVAENILQIVEKHCAVTYPELWLSVMKDVRATLEGAA